MSVQVSIITVNYFSEDEIIRCYHSINKKNSIDIELIIISNSPLERSFEEKLIALKIPYKIHQNDVNVGFAEACNHGASISDGDYLFFLNPDTYFINDVIYEMLVCHKESVNIGLIGPKTFNESEEPIQSIKTHLTKKDLWKLMFPFVGKQEPIIPPKTMSVEVINGHALFISAKMFKKLNGLEEKFFMYWEENDLCLRLNKLNKEIIYCTEAKLVHEGGTSTSPYFIKMEIEKHRSQKKFIKKHYPNWLFFNRISGCIGYFWRTLGSVFVLKKDKINQFGSLFIWYLTKYK